MLTVLGGLAEFERELILARTGAGRARAKAQGVRSVARVRSPPINAVRPWSASRREPRRQSWPAPTASRSQPLAGWLHPALSGQARSAREEGEVMIRRTGEPLGR